MRDIPDILEVAQRRNFEDGITGLLLADGLRYLQVIEGDEPKVRACYDRICRDDRHFDIVTIDDQAIDRRQFGSWSMDYHDHTSMTNGEYRILVTNLVAGVTDMWLRATFVGFAVLSR